MLGPLFPISEGSLVTGDGLVTWTWAEGVALGGRVGAMFTQKLTKFFAVSFSQSSSTRSTCW